MCTYTHPYPPAFPPPRNPVYVRINVQYLCEQCGLKRDAVRAIELIRLPAVLSIQLLRYVYSAKTGQRKKITAAVSLPLTLDMGPRLGYVFLPPSSPHLYLEKQ